MHHISLLISVFVSSVLAAELEDKPPTIVSISSRIGIDVEETVLSKPSEYVKAVEVSQLGEATNELKCKASNADVIKWEYRESDEAVWGDLPAIMVGSPVPNLPNNILELVITDDNNEDKEQLKTLNGFYHCVAENTKYGSVSQSAVINLVLAQITGTRPGILNVPSPGPVEGQPFTLPCYAENSDGDKITLVPEDAAKYTDITYKWVLIDGASVLNYPAQVADNPERIKVDPLNGALYYAYMKSTDTVSISQVLQCQLKVTGYDVVYPGEYNLLTVAAATQAAVTVDVLYPEYTLDSASQKIAKPGQIPTCISGEDCKVVVIFGGTAIDTNHELVATSSEDDSYAKVTDNTFFEFTAPIGDQEVQYKAELINKADGTVYDTLYLNIPIRQYPRLTDTGFFPEERLVPAGNNVKFECDAEYVEGGGTKFFINGQQVAEGTPSYVQYDSIQETVFYVNNAQRDHSFSVQCESANAAGTLYTTSVLNVYDLPVLKQYPTEDILRPASDNTTSVYLFNCSVTLDLKTTKSDIYWMTERGDGENQKITEKDSKQGVKSVRLEPYDAETGKIEAILTLEVTPQSQGILSNTDWWCVVEYEVLEEKVPGVQSERINFDFEQLVPSTAAPQTFTQWPLVIGVVAGVIFLILLIVLINCYVQKNKGEQYYVDEKERKAGHNPEEEMEAYGFSDYTRPDQNPIKGSRASMNMSDGKPMESDTGSLDEYGADVDPSRYNEDGSFIGQYGQNGHSSRNQADV